MSFATPAPAPTPAPASPAATSNELTIETFENMVSFKSGNMDLLRVVRDSKNAAAMSQIQMLISVGTHLYSTNVELTASLNSIASATKDIAASTLNLTKTNLELTAHTLSGKSYESQLLAQIAELTQQMQIMNHDMQFLIDQFVRNFKNSYGYESKDSCLRKECKGCCRITGVKQTHVTLTCQEALKAYFKITHAPSTLQFNVASIFEVTL